MITYKEFPPAVFSLVKKAITHDNGALIVINLPGALYFKAMLQMITPTRYYDENNPLVQILTILAIEVNPKTIVLPVFTWAICFICFMLVTSWDFITGIRASRKKFFIEHGHTEGYIESEKLWSSVWKTLGVVLISVIITFFCLLFAIGDMPRLYNTFLFSIIFFYLIVITFDIHSIGENHKKRYGIKPDFYIFIDTISGVIREGVIDWVRRKLSFRKSRNNENNGNEYQ